MVQSVQCLLYRKESYSKNEFDPGSERTLAICSTHASRTLLSLNRLLCFPVFNSTPYHGITIDRVGEFTVENKVANGCVTRGNLPNSSGQILNSIHHSAPSPGRAIVE